jgi:formamidopyrimidine-DNA glycosylase
MPELPEVQTICNGLREGSTYHPSLLGSRITGFAVFWAKTILPLSEMEFRSRILGQQIIEIHRRGKFIVLGLTSRYLLVHLRMSGDLIMKRNPHIQSKHDRVIFTLDDKWALVFNDTRKFGRIWLVDDEKEITKDLGIEPFDPNLDSECFHLLLQERHRQIKPLLLDQSFLAGIGNIYSDEALFLAKIHPLRPANNLGGQEANMLLTCIRQVLTEGIHHHGASIDWVYRGGDYQNFFRVYGRSGKPCMNCGNKIVRILVGQRSTHFCSICQVL